jgi:hypothetical protein
MSDVEPKTVDTMARSLQDAIIKMRSLGAVIVDPADVNFQPYIDLGFQALKSLYANERLEASWFLPCRYLASSSPRYLQQSLV